MAKVSNRPRKKASPRGGSKSAAHRGNKGQSKRAQAGDADKAIVEDKDNNPAWYAKNPELLRAAASLPFSQSLGSKITVPANDVVSSWDSDSFSGLMVLRCVLAPGGKAVYPNVDEEKESAMNVAANGIYTAIRSTNSGGKNYDAPNLMLYLLAMDNVYAFYSWMTRIYGCMKVYSQRNRYLPEMLVTAQGVSYDDIMERMAEFRYYINLFAAKASSMCVPAIMDYYERHFWLSQNVFADDQTLKAQMYMFVPACFFRYNPASRPFTTAATPALEAAFPIDAGTAYTLEEIRQFGNSLLRAVITDEDMNVMSGDILKAYGPDKLFRLTPIPEEHVVLPVYSEEVLTQIHNTTVLGIPSPSYVSQASQDYAANKLPTNRIVEVIDSTTQTGYLASYCSAAYIAKLSSLATPEATCNIRSISRVAPMTTLQVLNMHRDEVAPEDVMVATRLKPTFTIVKDNTYLTIQMNSTGSEWVCNASVYSFSWSETTGREITVTPFTSAMATLNDIEKWELFQQHPIVTRVEWGGSGINVLGLLGDIDNYTFVDNETLKRIHEVALLSQFDVPMLGVF